MEKSLNSPDYARLIELLVAVRHAAGVRQQALAKKLGRPQSFIAKYEGGERRLDVVEFARALGADPLKLFRDFLCRETGQGGQEAGRQQDQGWPLLRGHSPCKCGAAAPSILLSDASKKSDKIARKSTRLQRRLERYCDPLEEGPVNTATMHEAIKVCLKQINSKLAEASRLAQAAEACASAGSVAEGVEVCMDIEQLLCEASQLHDAVCLVNRIAQD